MPLRKEENLLGYITAIRKQVNPFGEKQIALLQSFAAQAVIAMENARLITETREALEQQTATAEVLGVINSSPGDLAPVFDAMLEKAMRLCDSDFGFMNSYDGSRFRPAAQRGVPAALKAYFAAGPDQPGPGEAHTRVLAGEDLIHSLDYKDEDAYRLGNPLRRAVVDLGGARTALVVALRNERGLLGTFTIYRREVRPFTDKQIALLQNFAAQAIIAIENARLITETREALEQQTATAEVLQVINASPGNLAPVFDTILEKATRLCEATFGILNTYDDERFRTVALRGVPRPLERFLLQSEAPQPAPESPPGRIIGGEDVIQVDDLAVLEGNRDSRGRAMVELGGARSYVTVALRKDGRLLGTIAAYRQQARPFSDKQVGLLRNFADQAVIAMENARLLTETREALEQQTATAEVLGVINSSPGDLAPVFEAMLEKALRLCEVAVGHLMTYDGTMVHLAASRGISPEVIEAVRVWAPEPESAIGQIVQGANVVQIADAADTDAYRAGIPSRISLVDLIGARTVLWIALRKDDALLGVFIVYRREVRPFSEKQIALLQNFAAQAVIAMENARLITETKEALEQQTATAEVLGVINSSPGDLAPVFDAMLEKAHSLCGVAIGALEIWDGVLVRAVATRGLTEEFDAQVRQGFEPEPNDPVWALVNGDRYVHVHDLAKVDDPTARDAVSRVGIGTFLAVALRKDNALLGRIVAVRREVRPFSEKEISLLENFAAQAVIAMENARLITETREALEQQTATAEVLGVINSSPGELTPVFDAMLEKAMHLCGAAFGQLATFDGERFRTAATRGVPAAFAEYRRNNPPSYGPGTTPARILQGERVICTEDLKAELAYQSGEPNRKALVDLGGARSAVIVALRKEDEILGFIEFYRQEVQPFADKQVSVLENFAAQAEIAIENARLLDEIRQRQAELRVTFENMVGWRRHV